MVSGAQAANADSNSTRNRVIDAALEVFAARGFKGATTKEIAKRARINEVTLFRLFKSKKGLFAAAVQERAPIARIRKEITLDLERPIEDVLFENIRTVLGTLRGNKHLYMLMLSESWKQSKSRDSPLLQPLNAALDYVSSFLEAQMEAGRLEKTDPRLCSMALMGAVQFYFMNTYVLGDSKPSESEEDKTIRRLVELFLHGVVPGNGGS